MVDSVLLLVDANEGPMPQTRYVLMRALRLGLRPIVIVNKADRPNADPHGALDKTFDLFLELGATDRQCDFPILYGSGLHGWVVRDVETDQREGLDALFQAIVDEVPAPQSDADAPFLMQVSTLGWCDHIGRTGTGRVLQGKLRKGDAITRITTSPKNAEWLAHGGDADAGEWEVTGSEASRATYLWATRGVHSILCDEVGAGDIVTIAGPKTLTIGDTIAAPELEGLRPAAARNRRADGVHAVSCQHRPLCGARGKRRHDTSDQGPPRTRTPHERRFARRRCGSRRWHEGFRPGANSTWPSSSRRCAAKGWSCVCRHRK